MKPPEAGRLAQLESTLKLRRLRGHEHLSEEEWNFATDKHRDWEGFIPEGTVLRAARRFGLAQRGQAQLADWAALMDQARSLFRGSRRTPDDNWTADEQAELLLLASAQLMLNSTPECEWRTRVRQIVRRAAEWPNLPDYFIHTWDEEVEQLTGECPEGIPGLRHIIAAHPTYWAKFGIMSGNEPVNAHPSVRRELRLLALNSPLPPVLLGARHGKAEENDTGRVLARIFGEIQSLPPLQAPSHPRSGGAVHTALLRGLMLPAYTSPPEDLDPKSRALHQHSQRENWRVLLNDLGLLMRTDAFIHHQGVSHEERLNTITPVRCLINTGVKQPTPQTRHVGLSLNLKSSLSIFTPRDPVLLRRCLQELWSRYLPPMNVTQPEEHTQMLRLTADLPPETEI